MKQHYLEFETEPMKIGARIADLREKAEQAPVGGEDLQKLQQEIESLEVEETKAVRQLYRQLSPWQKTQVARHPNRPHGKDYIDALCTGFTPIAGDRRFAEDAAIIAGFARLGETPVAVVATEKGTDTKSRVKHNFGMPKPEGYRKAQRLFALAEKFGLPIVAFVDTPGAYPGVEAEARGQADAIAACIEDAMGLRVPFVTYITGEGGSGGALALATADRVFMLEHSIYSVISPEGCASILWRSQQEAQKAAEALKITAQDIEELCLIEGIVPEPVGGAHRDKPLMIERVGEHLRETLDDLAQKGLEGFSLHRRERFLNLRPPSQQQG